MFHTYADRSVFVVVDVVSSTSWSSTLGLIGKCTHSLRMCVISFSAFVRIALRRYILHTFMQSTAGDTRTRNDGKLMNEIVRYSANAARVRCQSEMPARSRTHARTHSHMLALIALIYVRSRSYVRTAERPKRLQYQVE